MHQVIIIGSGPAGYCAGLYAARANLHPLMFNGDQPGGQLITTSSVENYLGLDDANGFELTETFKVHAVKYGLKIEDKTVVAVHKLPNGTFQVVDSDEHAYYTRAVIIATGASAKRMGLPNEDRLWGDGISACAVCDGALPCFRQKPLAVVGGGDTAAEEALFLSRFGSVVYLIHRRDTLRASHIMQERLRSHPKIQIMFNTIVDDVEGETCVEQLVCRNVQTGKISKIAVAGLFYGIGHTPNTGFLQESKLNIKCDEVGYILTIPGSTKTSEVGVFACGDVQDKKFRQAITAAGSGCMAALEVSEYLQEHNVIPVKSKLKGPSSLSVPWTEKCSYDTFGEKLRETFEGFQEGRKWEVKVCDSSNRVVFCKTYPPSEVYDAYGEAIRDDLEGLLSGHMCNVNGYITVQIQ
jgi:thioredoxin reductase (NADPH)